MAKFASMGNAAFCIAMLGVLSLVLAAGAADDRIGAQTRPAAPSTAPAVDAVRVPDVEGVPRRPLVLEAGQKAAVFLFLTTDCPISNSYAPELIRIMNAYAARGVRFYVVHTDVDRTPAEAKKHADAFGFSKAPCAVLMDNKRDLAHDLGACVTPQTVVVGVGGAIHYRGRIDDKWVDYGKSRVAPTTRNLRDALDAVLAGRPLAVRETEAIGCPIE